MSRVDVRAGEEEALDDGEVGAVARVAQGRVVARVDVRAHREEALTRLERVLSEAR